MDCGWVSSSVSQAAIFWTTGLLTFAVKLISDGSGMMELSVVNEASKECYDQAGGNAVHAALQVMGGHTESDQQKVELNCHFLKVRVLDQLNSSPVYHVQGPLYYVQACCTGLVQDCVGDTIHLLQVVFWFLLLYFFFVPIELLMFEIDRLQTGTSLVAL